MYGALAGTDIPRIPSQRQKTQKGMDAIPATTKEEFAYGQHETEAQ